MKLTNLLRWIYFLLFLGLPIYAVLYFTFSSEINISFSSLEKSFLERSFFLVIILHFFLAITWMKDLFKELKNPLVTLASPLVWMGVQRLFIPFTFGDYFAGMGIVYIMSLAIWFTYFIFDAIRRDPTYWKYGLLQLIFIIPALGTTFIFGKLLLVQKIIPQAQGEAWAVWLMCGAFIVSIFQPVVSWVRRNHSTAQ
jgi:hypothetical protein